MSLSINGHLYTSDTPLYFPPNSLKKQFEKVCIEVLMSENLFRKYRTNTLNLSDPSEFLYDWILSKAQLVPTSTPDEHLSRKILHSRLRACLLDLDYSDSTIIVVRKCTPMNIHRFLGKGTRPKVSFANLEAKEIIRRVPICDMVLAKFIDQLQKNPGPKLHSHGKYMGIGDRMAPYAKTLVQLAVTGMAHPSPSQPVFELFVTEECSILDLKVSTVDAYVKSIMCDEQGNITPVGFGTGLYWTFQPYTKGTKIQFQG